MLSGAISGRLGFNTYEEVVDVTRKRDDFLSGNASETDESYKILIVGKPRSGKTHEALYYIDRLMRANKNRKLCLFRCPHELFEVLTKYAPWKDRIYETFYLTEIQNYSVIFIDEGLISANAKEALRTDNRQLGKSLAFISHKGCVFIINAQDEGVLKDIRRKVDWIVFKRLSKMYIDETDDPIVKKYAQKLMNLKKSKSYLVSNVFGFEIQGTTDTDMISWWNDEISKNLAQVSLDTEFEREKKLEEMEKKTAERLIKRFGLKRVEKAKFTELAEGYLSIEDSYTYFLLKGRMHKVCNMSKYFAYLEMEKREKEKRAGKSLDEEDEDELEGGEVCEAKDEVKKPESVTFRENCTFAEYAAGLIKLETNKPQFAETISMYLNSMTYEQIGDRMEFSKPIVHRRVRWFQKAEPGRKSLQGRYFERWWSFTNPKGKLGGGRGEVDWRDENGDIYSLKCQYIDRKVAQFYKDVADGMDSRVTLRPEYRAAKSEGKEFFYLIFYNPAWKPEPIKVKVPVSGDIIVIIWKPEDARSGVGRPKGYKNKKAGENNLLSKNEVVVHEATENPGSQGASEGDKTYIEKVESGGN